ncbi:MAG: LuxR C-terminal-related transcriptional regulator [Pseudomonadota bacterium]
MWPHFAYTIFIMTEHSGVARVVLSSKLNPPTTTPSQVTRTKVRDLVRMSQSVKLILVRAPAGFGKTTAMVQCRAQLEENGIDTAWLTLDSGDNDASRFLACLAAAVARMGAEPPAYPAETGQPLGLSPGDIALDIMERLAAHTAPFALILDDFEHVQEPTVLELVRELIDHLPRRGQLIIGSRGLPDLGLGRLRARGQLLEIDAGQLRFSIEETVEFFTQRRNIALQEADLSALHHKTEGWIAALWLASMALERHEGRTEFIARFAGSHEALADYLADDVLARQPAHLRDFLLRTSILRHLNASLCDALLARNDSAQMLGQLEAANLFLLPIEGVETTYRYHSLFAGFLRAQLTREMPDELPRLHRAASQWYEAQGRPVPAIDHALDGRYYEHALTLLSQHGEHLLEEGRMRLLTRWFAAIPEQTLRNLPLLQMVQVWALCFTRGPREGMALLESSACAHSDDPAVRSYVLALRPAMLAMMDRNEDAYREGTEALSNLSLTKPFADSALANMMAYIFCLMGQHQQSHRLLDAARRSQSESTSFFNRMYSESIEGLIDLEEGRLRQATARFRMAVSSTHAASYTHTHGNAFAGVLFADALYEANELGQAAHLMHVYVPLAKDVGLPDHMIIGYLRLARIAFYRGDIDMVFQSLTELEYVGHHRQLPRVVASAKLERARVLLLQGNKQASKEELQRANDLAIWDRVRDLRMPAHDLEYFELGQLRWYIHFGDAAGMLPRLDVAIADAAASSRHRRVLKLKVLKSLALKRSGDQRGALATMEDVLQAACKEGFQRLIIDEGDGVGRLVRQLLESTREKSTGRSDPIFSEYLQRLLQGFGAVSEEEEPALAPQNGLAEPLTPKEIRILLLLADGYSNSALAEKLFVSDSTVRTHLRNINAKLNAQSRTQAVAIARRLGFIR